MFYCCKSYDYEKAMLKIRDLKTYYFFVEKPRMSTKRRHHVKGHVPTLLCLIYR